MCCTGVSPNLGNILLSNHTLSSVSKSSTRRGSLRLQLCRLHPTAGLRVWPVIHLCIVQSLLTCVSPVTVLQVYPEGGGEKGGGGKTCLPRGSFLSCSSDNTIRLWSIDGHSALHRNILSNVGQHTPAHRAPTPVLH